VSHATSEPDQPVSIEDFRRAAHEAVEWVARYLEEVRQYPVLPRLKPGELTARLPRFAPEAPEPLETIARDFESEILPAVTHWNHPRFLAYFAISGSPPGILAELLSAALNVNGMLWKTCPAATELEQVTLGWLRDWLGLDRAFFGIVYDTASIGCLHALVAARHRICAEARQQGHPAGLKVYCSEFAHSSIEKAAITAGFGQGNVRKIGADAEYRMRPDDLERAIEEDRRAGCAPCCVVATVGTTAVASVDPVDELAGICERHRAWLHVDAAYGGTAAILPECRHILDGCDRADSMIVNPHKWLLTPVDFSAFYTRHPDVLRAAFSLTPEYLRTAEEAGAVNLMDYGVQLGRRFRALKLWFVMRAYGRQGLQQIVRTHCALAQEFVSWLQADPRFELCAPVHFSLVCFRLRGPDAPNRRMLEEINSSGIALLSHTVLNDRFVLRLAIGNFQTTRDDLRQVWLFLREFAETGGA